MPLYQAIGAAKDATRMRRVVGLVAETEGGRILADIRVLSFYEKLPRGSAPEIEARGLFARYKRRYFGDKPSAMRMNATEL